METSSDRSTQSTLYRERLERARSAAAAHGLDALFVIPGPDLAYLTGATIGATGGSRERLTALLIPTHGRPAHLVVSNLELSAYEHLGLDELGIRTAIWADGQDPFALVRRAQGVELGGVLTGAELGQDRPASDSTSTNSPPSNRAIPQRSNLA